MLCKNKNLLRIPERVRRRFPYRYTFIYITTTVSLFSLNSFIKFSPMLVGHVGWSKQCNSGSSGLNRTTYSFTDFRWNQTVTFRIFDICLVLPVVTNKQTTVNRLFTVYGSNFFLGYFSNPRSRFQIEVVLVHREEGIDIPFIPFLTNQFLCIRIRTGEYSCTDFFTLSMNRSRNFIY